MRKGLNIGCGTNPSKSTEEIEFINIDIVQLDGVNMIYDLNEIPYPFDDETFDLIIMHDILEHLNKPIEVMREVHRLLKKGGKVKIKVVYWNHRFTYADPQHKWGFSVERYFKVFTGEIRAYYLDFHFEDLKIVYHFDQKAIEKYGNDPEVLLEKGYFHTNVIQGANIELTKPRCDVK